jgi:hypothetical protein
MKGDTEESLLRSRGSVKGLGRIVDGGQNETEGRRERGLVVAKISPIY